MKNSIYLAAAFVGILMGGVAVACEDSPREEADEAVKALENGDPKQAVEEAGEAAGAAIKEVTQ